MKQKVIRIAVIILFFMTACTMLAETWELVNVISQREDTQVVNEVVEVRFCTSTAESKTVDCSAGTSNDLTIGAVVEGGGGVGNGFVQGNVSVGAEVASSLGFNRNSGESLKLDSPTEGFVFLYPVEKSYRVFTGNVLATSSSGNEAELQYTFNASCSLRLGEKEITTCDGNPVESAESQPVVLTTTESSPTPIPHSTTPATPTIDSSQFTNGATVDALFGTGNWFCFPDRENGLGVKRIPASFVVQSPLRLVVTYQGDFSVGQLVPQIGATAELEKPLLQSECPSSQLEPLVSWANARSSDVESFDQSRMNKLFGTNNWQCISEFSYAVSVTQLLSDLSVQYPITFVTHYDSTNYGVGEVVPKGQQATVWLGGSIPKSECP